MDGRKAIVRPAFYMIYYWDRMQISSNFVTMYTWIFMIMALSSRLTKGAANIPLHYSQFVQLSRHVVHAFLVLMPNFSFEKRGIIVPTQGISTLRKSQEFVHRPFHFQSPFFRTHFRCDLFPPATMMKLKSKRMAADDLANVASSFAEPFESTVS